VTARRKRSIVWAAALFVIWSIAAPFLADLLIVKNSLEHADAMIVLSGSAVYKERTRKAADLYRQGIAKRIFISDDGTRSGWLDDEAPHQPFVALEKRELLSHGVPPEAITILPGKVFGTDDEAKAMKAEIDARPLNSLLIVTSAYHTRRAFWTFKKIFGDGKINIGIDAPPPGDRTPRPVYWWLTPRGWQTVAGEYVKLAVYYFYY
jgi:uncharacterized SAM-binding protein YcdF (DUF218 family)